jgi:hemerythrin-like metal-binding protein
LPVKPARHPADIRDVFAWYDSYSIGVPHVDAQHQQLFAIAEKLFRAVSEGQAHFVVAQALLQLDAYASTHSADEERIMRSCGYPDYERHKTEHARFSLDVQQLSRDFDAGRVAPTIQMLQSFKDWLVRHITVEDRRIAVFVRAAGVAGHAAGR